MKIFLFRNEISLYFLCLPPNIARKLQVSDFGSLVERSLVHWPTLNRSKSNVSFSPWYLL